MKTIKLKRLTLQDWRAQNKVVEFSDNTEIRGYNKSGKSSVYNAFLWLLTGCDAEDRANYNLFDNTIEQTHESSKVASVEGIFEIDGIEYTFKRTAEIGWVRKKGREEYERKGSDTYKFFVDGIERNAGDFKKAIEDLFAPIDKLKIMLNLQYPLKMDWKEMRRHLQGMAGEISMSDFTGDYSDILNDLNKYPIDELKSVYKAKIKPIKQSIESLPIAISTLQSNLPDITGLDDVQNEIDEAKSQIERIDEQIEGSEKSIKEYIDKRNEKLYSISRLEIEYKEAEAKYLTDKKSKEIAIKNKIAEISFRNSQILNENNRNKKTIEEAKERIKMALSKLEKLNEYRNTLLKQNEEVKAMQFTNDTCAYCGQTLPEDKLNEAREKFNRMKEQKHISIVQEGKANNLRIEQCRKEIEELKALIEKGYKEKPLIDDSELKKELAEIGDKFVPYEETTEGKEKLAKIALLHENLEDIPKVNNDALKELKKSLIQDIQDLSKRLRDKDNYDSQMELIKLKQKELKDSSVELARLEGLIHLVEQYEKEKAQIISDRVNGMFDFVHVEMNSVNKSGELVPDCRILDAYGVNASVTNFASQIRCGIDISTAFCKFYGVNLPMFIDFAESICEDNYPETDRQTIKLIVDNCKFNVVNK